ncbi:glutamyl-tRNA reductase [Paenibacillus sp. J2TS4]|uniref:glutamyl-tRNA reductase n=1 Tax=Paenibacillus sp. J2TS4 TaxID=2807194 RepID=UPI001B17BC2A|nr:glutamyl-tRNA reductase [Paenibacillus sp. J2TS4]GIP31343.1 glutamyl-tRNA reductase [Paenibacillus sp. J2TS4]
MHIIVVGLNYKTAPVEIREKFAFAKEDLPEALAQLKKTKSILECVIVGTCNRTEIYAVVDRMYLCGHAIRGFIEEWFGIPRQQFNHHLYVKEDEHAIRHLFQVTSGLDSMIIGETQILGQVREAFLLSQKEKVTGPVFNTLFKQAVTMAKRAHSETGIADNPVSVSYAAVELGKRIFGSFAKKSVLLIGAGKMSELTAKHLRANGASRVVVANRTYEKAVEFADKFAGEAISFDELTRVLAETDIVISSTGSPGLVINRQQVESMLHLRKSKPLFMIDIAVPRDLDPHIGELSNVFLYDIDDLQSIVESNLAEREKIAAEIEAMIAEEEKAFDEWFKTMEINPLINALQTKASRIHEETMESMLKKLPDLSDREVKVIRKLTKSIVNQMMRDPIVRFKEMAGGKDGKEAIAMFSHLFALESVTDGQNEEEEAEPMKAGAGRANDKLPLLGLQLQEALARS